MHKALYTGYVSVFLKNLFQLITFLLNRHKILHTVHTGFNMLFQLIIRLYSIWHITIKHQFSNDNKYLFNMAHNPRHRTCGTERSQSFQETGFPKKVIPLASKTQHILHICINLHT